MKKINVSALTALCACLLAVITLCSMQGYKEENYDHYKTIEHQGVEGFNQECRELYNKGYIPHSELHVYMNGKFAVYYQQWRKP